MSFLRKTYVFLLLISGVLALNTSYAASESFHKLLSSVLPHEKIQVNVLKKSIVLSGIISNVEASDRAERLAQEFYGSNVKVLNFMKIKGSQQVMLRVKIGEVRRDIMGSYQNSSASFDYLADKGLLRTLAEPNLVALSGERAEFLAGGEFPVPVTQKDGYVAINYKSYGVKVAFTPLVLSSNRIRINVEQELSGLKDYSNMKLIGYNVPSLDARRASTTIELAPGESFMIAGLIRDDVDNKMTKETELVMSVSAYLVDPMKAIDVSMPTVNAHYATKLEKNFIETIAKGKDNNSNDAELSGPVGFIAE
jgi:pilus assembly protein CpaC